MGTDEVGRLVDDMRENAVEFNAGVTAFVVVAIDSAD
jgi:hypothetical protein